MTVSALKDYPALPRDVSQECAQFRVHLEKAATAPSLNCIRDICQSSRKLLYAFEEDLWGRRADDPVWNSRRQTALEHLDAAIQLRESALRHNPSTARKKLGLIFDKLITRRDVLASMGA